MQLKDELKPQDIFIQTINDDSLKDLSLDVLRLDKIHPVVSGNKWFKLKYHLEYATKNNIQTIATFGGAFSNHIIATAYVCKQQNLNCIGFIRGEEPRQYSQTLKDAIALNMQLKFISREAYKDKSSIINSNPSFYFIPEGGYGTTGAKGAAEILNMVPDLSKYNYFICAVGTGTMVAGVTNASLAHQKCIGISVLKNNFSIENETKLLVNKEAIERFIILHDYHFGGYAKYTSSLINFMNTTWKEHQLPLDFVYTAKAFYAIHDLFAKQYFKPQSKILFIHSGGLQGNNSIQEKLAYQSY